MSYEKQTWNKYDDLKTEEENIENGAVVTDNRMNHIEDGIYSHTIDISNPHKVTATQLGLDKVDNIQQAAKIDFDSHVNNKANPHAVTASQVGAYSKQEIDTKLSKAVMADDSGKVAVNDLNVNGKISDLGMSNFTPRTTTWSSNGVNIAFTRVGPLVIGVWGGSQSNVAQGFTYTTPVPSGFRPNTQAKLLVIQSAVSNINIDTNGIVRYWGVPATNGNLSGMLTYFTNDPFPES